MSVTNAGAAPGSASGASSEAASASGEPGSENTSDSKAQLREEFWNLPNQLTLLRIAVVPVLLILPFSDGLLSSRILAWCFIAAALTDIVDGWLARRDGGALVTRIGKLLDPLADKLLVSTAFIMLVAVDRIPIWATWMVVVIIGRELAVTGLRGIASSQGHIVAASWHGKAKTLAQNIAAGALIFYYPIFGLPAREIGLAMLVLATVLTLWSGWVYFANYFWDADEA